MIDKIFLYSHLDILKKIFDYFWSYSLYCLS